MKLLRFADLSVKELRPILNKVFPVPTLVQRLPIKGLIRTEKVLNPSQVDYYKRLTPDHLPVSIVSWKGRKFIWDGNHRVHARLNKGLKTVRAHLYAIE